MAEIVLGADDDLTGVVRALLDLAGDPDQVVWSPRADVPQGGVYVVPDDLAAAYSGAASGTKKGRRSATTTTTDAGTSAEGTGTAA